MKRILLFLLLLFVSSSAYSQPMGTFSDEFQIRADTSTSLTDTTMIDTLSREQEGWPVMTIFYKFLDTGTVSTTLYFESVIQGRLSSKQYVIVDSLVVSSVSSNWEDWNITDGAIGITKRWRLRKSTSSDTLMAIFKGFNEGQQ